MIVTLKSTHRLDDLLGAAGLARSTFFYHQQRLTMPDRHAQLKQAIIDIFERMNRRFGYRRVHAQLRREGWSVNHKLVYKLMNELGLKSKVRVKKKYNSYKGTVSHIARNVLDRRFTPEKPNAVWASDVTEFRVACTKVYLSPIMDLYDRTICRTACLPHRIPHLQRSHCATPSRNNNQVKVCLCTRIKGSNTSIPAGVT